MNAPIEARPKHSEAKNHSVEFPPRAVSLCGWLQLFLGGNSTELFLARMKRFSDTARFDEGWYVELPPEMKAAWELLWAKCDCAGVWEPSFKLAEFQIGKKVAWTELAERLKGRIVILPSGAWWLRDFVKMQCGELSAECRAHIPVINRLREHNLMTTDSLCIDYPMTINSHKEKEKEEYKGKEGGVKRGDVLPTSPEAIAIANLFSRQLTTEWNRKEIEAFSSGRKRGAITVEAVALIAAYYASERAKGGSGIHRRDLLTFLNNFDGELDRANAFKANPKAHERTNPNQRSDSPRNIGHNANRDYSKRTPKEATGTYPGLRETLDKVFLRVPPGEQSDAPSSP